MCITLPSTTTHFAMTHSAAAVIKYASAAIVRVRVRPVLSGYVSLSHFKTVVLLTESHSFLKLSTSGDFDKMGFSIGGLFVDPKTLPGGTCVPCRELFNDTGTLSDTQEFGPAPTWIMK